MTAPSAKSIDKTAPYTWDDTTKKYVAFEDKQDEIIDAINAGGGGTSIVNAIEEIAYDLNAASFSETTNLSNDYFFNSVLFNFTTTENRTITITGHDGTVLWNDTNTDDDIVVCFDNKAFNANDNITIEVTQTSGACSMDCIMKVQEGSAALVGNPVLGAGEEVIGKVSLVNENNDIINVQEPLPTDGDSVYVKDLDTIYCDNGDFSGDVTDYFNSLKSINTNTTSDNPKIIKLWFKRTIYAHTIGLGCDNMAKNFGSSITIELLGSGEVVRKTVNSIGDINSRLIEFGAAAFNGINLKFNTASEVCISNITIQKSTESNTSIHGLDPDGNVQDVLVDVDGNLSISNNSSGLAIAENRVTGKTFIHKFGNALDFDISDGFVTVWDGADDGSAWELMNIIYSSTDDIDSISSSDNSDTQAIEIQGLDVNFDLVVQTITLTGQTRKALDTNLIRIFRMKNVDSIDIAGNVIGYVNGTLSSGVPTDKTKIRAIIHGDNNQTEMAVYTIPAGKTGYMRDWYASTAGARKDSSHTIKLFARPYGEVFQLKHTANIDVNGTSYIKHEYKEPEIFSEKTDIEIRMNTSENEAGVSAGFDIVLSDN